jgi:hypothetical protein
MKKRRKEEMRTSREKEGTENELRKGGKKK